MNAGATSQERRDVWVLTFFSALVLLAGAALVAACFDGLYRGAAPARGVLVIRGGTRFDGRPLENGLLVVQDDRIACVGTACRVPDGAAVVDASGLAILPGLVDLATYLGASVESDARRPLPLFMWDYARLLPGARRAFLEAGVTTVRDLGNVEGVSFALRSAIDSGRLAGPRVLAVGPVFTAPMGIPASTDFGGNLWVIEQATRQVTDPDAARAEVRRLANAGVAGIGAVCDGGVIDALPRLASPVLHAIAEEAHARGLWLAVRTGRLRDVREAVLAGADTVEHGALYDGPLDSETTALMHAHGVTFVPSLAGTEAFLRWVQTATRPDGYPVEAWEGLRHRMEGHGPLAILPHLFASVQAAVAAGVPIGAGPAGGRALGASLHRELELLVDAGLSPADALVASTRNAARALRRDADLGTLEPGKLADLVLVSGRPWERIGDVENVRLVIQGGRVVVHRTRT